VSHQDFVVISSRAVARKPGPGTRTWLRNQAQAKYWYSRSPRFQHASATVRRSSSVGAGKPAVMERLSAPWTGAGRPRNGN
jgi:hypothetical protein